MKTLNFEEMEMVQGGIDPFWASCGWGGLLLDASLAAGDNVTYGWAFAFYVNTLGCTY